MTELQAIQIVIPECSYRGSRLPVIPLYIWGLERVQQSIPETLTLRQAGQDDGPPG